MSIGFRSEKKDLPLTKEVLRYKKQGLKIREKSPLQWLELFLTLQHLSYLLDQRLMNMIRNLSLQKIDSSLYYLFLILHHFVFQDLDLRNPHKHWTRHHLLLRYHSLMTMITTPCCYECQCLHFLVCHHQVLGWNVNLAYPCRNKTIKTKRPYSVCQVISK